MSEPPERNKLDVGPTSDEFSKAQQAEIAATSFIPLTVEGIERRQAEADGDLTRALEQSRRDYAVEPANRHNDYAVQRALSNDFIALDDLDGDTVIYIGPPPKENNQSATDYSYIVQHFSKTHCIDSRHVKAMESGKLDKLLGPKSLVVERRLRKSGALRSARTEGIKFYVDLQPPDEDEEAIVLVTELTCTKGVLLWHKAQAKYGISKSLICGSDDFTSLIKTMAQSELALERSSWESGPSRNKNGATGKASQSKNSKDTIGGPETQQCAPEYSFLRHRSGIERLIHAITLGDPMLDSAPKVWTYFAIAKYFDCATHERISGWITKWLLNGQNSNFIQNNPEVAYRIGMGIASPDVTRMAFSILVGEKALLDMAAERNPDVLSQGRSVHGRLLELLDEDERNRVGHAAASLVLKIRTKFENLIGHELSWLQQCKEYQKVVAFKARTPEEQEAIQGVLDVVHNYMRGRINWALCRNYYIDFPGLEDELAEVQSFHPMRKDKFCHMYNSLSLSERLLTKTFWLGFAHGAPIEGNTNTWSFNLSADHFSQVDQTKAMTATIERAQRCLGPAVVKLTMQSDLKTVLRTYNELRSKQYDQDHDAHLEQQKMQPLAGVVVDEKVSSSEHNGEPMSGQVYLKPQVPWETMTHFQYLTKADSQKASKYLAYTGGDVDLAVRRYLANGGNDFPVDRSLSNVSGFKELKSQNDAAVSIFKSVPSIHRSPDGVSSDTGSPLPTKSSASFSESKPLQRPSPALANPINNPMTEGFLQNLRTTYVDMSSLLYETSFLLSQASQEILHPAHLYHGAEEIPTDLVDCVMCLDDAEWKYLPLWAGGNDDGTGGVFDEVDVPNLEAGGWRGGKRGMGSVNSRGEGASSASEVSSFDDIDREGVSTVGRASRDATLGQDGETLMSFSEAATEEFMRQDELWDQARAIK